MSDIVARAREIAADRDSGASELLAQLLPLLDEALAQGPAAVAEVTRLVCEGQTAMAPLWHACAAALRETDQPGSFHRFRQARERAPAALVRVASASLLDEWSNVERPLALTLSFSGSVRDVLRAVHGVKPLRVVCGEGRPRFEGRRLAAELSQAGVDVTVTTDAGVARYLAEAAAVVVGADAVATSHWINKVGTTGVAAAAQRLAVPVFVVTTADKSMPSSLASRWQAPAADPAEVWEHAPPTIHVDNHYFETVPAELATGLLTEFGRLSASDFPAFAQRGAGDLTRLLDLLSRQ